MAAPKQPTEVRQQEIAQAALKIIATRGMKGLRVSAVARQVGLVPSGIYRHYRSKETLIDAVLDFIRARLAANALDVTQMEGDTATRLHALLMKQVDLIRENESIPQVIFSQEVYTGHPERRAKLLGIIQGFLAKVAGIVAEGQQAGDVRRDIDPAVVALMFLGLFQPPTLLWHLQGGSFDVQKQAEAAWAIFHRAIRSERSSTDVLQKKGGA
ncbi:MAG: TetR/AcrR family transcriptional regulator [Kiritimatiellia bacterium]|jgi:AcrR family transcriptional regulator|nr:TetR/AcrR family transcriptional regulator [Kiritimatiellia bacterium]